MTCNIMLSARVARYRLNNESCKVIINKAHATDTFITKPGIFEHEGKQCVRVPKEKIIVPITDISKIEIEVSKFTPDKKTFMEVKW